MEVILLERVAKLGQMGEVVRVKDGFARNFLLKRGKALRATVTLTLTSTSGCTAMAIWCLPMVLIGASSRTWLRLMVTPSASKEAMMSRTLTEPNN